MKENNELQKNLEELITKKNENQFQEQKEKEKHKALLQSFQKAIFQENI